MKQSTDELVQLCLQKLGAWVDYPFGPDTIVMKVADKMFALIYEKEDCAVISLKCEPLMAELLRSEYPAVRAGYHLNKRHWNSVTVDGTVPDEELIRMIGFSYDLVSSKLSKTKKLQLYADFGG